MKLWNSMVFPRKLSTNCWVSTSMLIRRPLPSLSLGGAAPGITEGVRHGPVPALCFAMMVPPEAPLAVSIGLRNCYVARFQLPPEAPQAVSIGLRNCYVARFWIYVFVYLFVYSSIFIDTCICRCTYVYIYNINIPVVPHKAVAEVSKIGNL